jgi:hypothetical protein
MSNDQKRVEDHIIQQFKDGKDLPHFDIGRVQPNDIKPGPISMEVGISIDGRYVNLLFPRRLEAMEGLGLSKQEAIYLGRLLIEKASLLK